jgi:DNA transformation protein
VSSTFPDFAREQLARALPITTRKMFGALGVYARGLFFAIVTKDAVYFRVDDATRPEYEARGCGPFDPYGDGRVMSSSYRVPDEVLEDTDELRRWAEASVEAAARKKRGG